jgi:hypothetical protein
LLLQYFWNPPQRSAEIGGSKHCSLPNERVEFVSFVYLFPGAAQLSERPAYTYANPETGLLAIHAICCALVAAGSHLR